VPREKTEQDGNVTLQPNGKTTATLWIVSNAGHPAADPTGTGSHE
jgi:hypothetical protein